MKLSFIAAVTLLTTAVHAESRPPARTLDVYVMSTPGVPADILGPAKETVRKIYERIGIFVRYRHSIPTGGQARREKAMAVHVTVDCEDSAQGPATARPYEGSWIRVCYGRLKWAEKDPPFARRLLGYIVAHEIAHNLQGVARHSDAGIMKPQWTAPEYNRISVHELRFDPQDVRLIDLGWQARHSRPAELALKGSLR